MLVSSRAEERDSPGLQFVSNKHILNFIPPFDLFQFLEVFSLGFPFPRLTMGLVYRGEDGPKEADLAAAGVIAEPEKWAGQNQGRSMKSPL